MLSTLYLLHFNNYYNRIVEAYEYPEYYEDYLLPEGKIQGINFIPNDNLNTTQVINWKGADPDYILVIEGNDIKSRWFVINAVRTTMGQYKLELHRDVLADFRDQTLNSVGYIRRAVIPEDNKLIYNSEGIRFNQIKTREDLLYDITKSPWIVGYMDRTATGLKGANIAYSSENAPLTNYQEIYQLGLSTQYLLTRVSRVGFYTRYDPNIFTGHSYYYGITPSNVGGGQATVTSYETSQLYAIGDHFKQSGSSITTATNFYKNEFAGKNEIILATLARYKTQYTTDDSIFYYNGKTVYDSQTRNYYKISVTTEKESFNNLPCSSKKESSIYNDLVSMITNASSISATNDSSFTIQFYYTPVKLKLELVNYGDYTVDIKDNARALEDAPYRMFCMKYTPQNYMLAIELATQNSGKMYDVQLLPYCPVQNYFNDDGSLKDLKQFATENVDYNKITKGTTGETLDYLFWCRTSVGTFNIPYTVEIENLKQEIECDMYRLCSPNGNGTFEFNAAKSGGVAFINVDYSYRPYDPYIHLNPNFGELYGQDYNDFRGLILNGDFSIPRINDAWVDYTTQNKNFQNIFNREVQSLELQQHVQRVEGYFNAMAGVAEGAAAGGQAGENLGGAYGKAIGTVVGTAVSAVGAAIDLKHAEQLRQDQMGMKRDMFSYNLQNIQALPQSISKTGCLTNNNKLVPYVEYYTCTDEEKELLANKIKYMGMTVGTTGRIGDFVNFGGRDNPQYIEADIIKLDLDEDYHISMEIAKELSMGARYA